MPENNETIKNDGTIALQPIPAWVKYGGAALAAVVVIILLLFTTTGDDEPATNLVDLESDSRSSFPPLSENIDAQLIDVAKELEQTFESDPEQLAKTGNAYPELSLPFASDTSETLKKLEQLQSDLTEFETANDSRQNQQDVLIKDLQDRLMSQQLQIDQVLKHLQPKKPIRKPVKQFKPKPRPAIAPFSLVSVDQWGSESYAVFRYQGQLVELTIGQAIDQWTVEDMNRVMGTVTIKNQSGERKVLSIQS
ncbi:MAG: hypothetical protein CVV06_16055 [Gammaproteobacteria bacterium HGW-Gammaproteobacteria-10]|nr:MAG: hypothetical protein CVV06_16055 [Gammaproteobacteria bacterium HGW-Gammaproteobacteria-10]